jgi:hypothetical protein
MTRRFGMLTRAALLVAVVLLSNVVSAQLDVQLNAVCQTIKGIVPIVALLMFIMAGGIYAIGQVLGAETRARASVWATAMLVGGVIGLIIAASAGYLLTMFMNSGIGTSTIGTPMSATLTC